MAQILTDYEGRGIRLTDERLYQHILVEHPQIGEIANAIAETLRSPELVVISNSNRNALLYYRWYLSTKFGDKWVCVVVIVSEGDAFVATSYLTDRIKRGELAWHIRG